MKIEKNRSSRMWTLTAGGEVLYSGRRSPWEHPSIMHEALEREQALQVKVPNAIAPPGRTLGGRQAARTH